MPPEFETIEWSFDDATGVGRITLDRPDALNALSSTLRREFVEAFAAFRTRDDAADGVAVRAVVVSGTGRAFSVGRCRVTSSPSSSATVSITTTIIS